LQVRCVATDHDGMLAQRLDVIHTVWPCHGTIWRAVRAAASEGPQFQSQYLAWQSHGQQTRATDIVIFRLRQI
jgi:hypothetical protein